MNRTTHRQLHIPMVMAASGTAIAVAAIVGRGVGAGAIVEAVTIAAALGYYVVGRHDSDEGALLGSRADERQEGIGLRARALAGEAMTAVALGGFAVQTARGHDTWPFALLCVVGAISFVAGITIYRRP